VGVFLVSDASIRQACVYTDMRIYGLGWRWGRLWRAVICDIISWMHPKIYLGMHERRDYESSQRIIERNLAMIGIFLMIHKLPTCILQPNSDSKSSLVISSYPKKHESRYSCIEKSYLLLRTCKRQLPLSIRINIFRMVCRYCVVNLKDRCYSRRYNLLRTVACA